MDNSVTSFNNGKMKAAFFIFASALSLTACGSWTHPQYTGDAGRAQFERDKADCVQSAQSNAKAQPAAAVPASNRPTTYSVHTQDMGGGYTSATVTPTSPAAGAPVASKYDGGAKNVAQVASRDACLRAKGWSFSTSN